jgi:DivIVA domain-containing protein
MTNVEFTSDVVRSATFREKLKGYNPEDVHAFMERSAAAIDQLTARLGEATARAMKAEAALASNSEADESVRRTLVLAQRTAEMAVREANDEAASIRFEARREADQLLEQVRAEAAELQADSTSRAAAMTREADRLHAEADAHATATVTDADTYTQRVRADADARAAATLAEAEAQASGRIADAEARAEELDATVAAELATKRTEIVEEIEQYASAIRQETEAEIAALRAQHRELWADIEALSEYLAGERARILEGLQGSVDRFGDLLTPAARPDVAPPEAVDEVGPIAAISDPDDGTQAADYMELGHHDEVAYDWPDPDERPDGTDNADRGEDAFVAEFVGEYDDRVHEPVTHELETGDAYGWTRGWVAEQDPVLAEPVDAHGETDTWGQDDLADTGTGPDEGYGGWADAARPSQWEPAAPSPAAWDAGPSPAAWDAGPRPAAGWADAAAYRPSDETPDARQPEPAWRSPVEGGYAANWAPEAVAAEPAWEWPGRTDAGSEADPGPAAAWFGEESRSAANVGAAGGGAAWPTPAWGAAEVGAEHDWNTGTPDPGHGTAEWGSTAPAAWPTWPHDAADGPADVPADADETRDPWEGIEPVESTWTEAPADNHPPVQRPPSLLFTLGDEARTGTPNSAPPVPVDPAAKQRRTLLGRLKG